MYIPRSRGPRVQGPPEVMRLRQPSPRTGAAPVGLYPHRGMGLRNLRTLRGWPGASAPVSLHRGAPASAGRLCWLHSEPPASGGYRCWRTHSLTSSVRGRAELSACPWTELHRWVGCTTSLVLPTKALRGRDLDLRGYLDSSTSTVPRARSPHVQHRRAWWGRFSVYVRATPRRPLWGGRLGSRQGGRARPRVITSAAWST